MAIVPTCALDYKRGSSGSYLSSEFSKDLGLAEKDEVGPVDFSEMFVI